MPSSASGERLGRQHGRRQHGVATVFLFFPFSFFTFPRFAFSLFPHLTSPAPLGEGTDAVLGIRGEAWPPALRRDISFFDASMADATVFFSSTPAWPMPVRRRYNGISFFPLFSFSPFRPFVLR